MLLSESLNNNYITMRKTVIFLLAVVGVSVSSYAQLKEKIREQKVVSGAIYKNGAEIEGYIQAIGTISYNGKDYPAPWQFQSSVKFIPKEIFENTEKIKNSAYILYDAGSCDGYRYDTTYYESVKNGKFSSDGISGTAKKIFLKRILESKVSLFHYFKTPPNASPYQANEYEIALENCAIVNVVYRKGNEGVLKLVRDLIIEKDLSDCPIVVEGYAAGKYRSVSVGGNASGITRLLNRTMFREQVRMMAIEDYNKNCN